MRTKNAGKKCAEKGCSLGAYCKGLCQKHYGQSRYRTSGVSKAERSPARKSPPPKATSPATNEDLERFCTVARALGFDADALLEQAELDFARAWLEDLRGRVQVEVAAPSPLQLRAPRVERPKPQATPAPSQRKLEPLPPADALDSPRVAAKSTKGLKMGSAECDGCGGVVSCTPGCPVKKHAA